MRLAHQHLTSRFCLLASDSLLQFVTRTWMHSLKFRNQEVSESGNLEAFLDIACNFTRTRQCQSTTCPSCICALDTGSWCAQMMSKSSLCHMIRPSAKLGRNVRLVRKRDTFKILSSSITYETRSSRRPHIYMHMLMHKQVLMSIGKPQMYIRFSAASDPTSSASILLVHQPKQLSQERALPLRTIVSFVYNGSIIIGLDNQ